MSIIVLLSTYNGEKFLREQLNSLFGQKNVNMRVLVRDDGSTDKTVDILKLYEKNNLCWYKGNNIGPAKSFFQLIHQAGNAKYYAFCDQDDVWDNDKLEIAINAISKYNQDIPIFYHCLPGRVDEKLNPLLTPQSHDTGTFGSALMTTAVGCTVVINKKLMDLIREYTPGKDLLHDTWAYRLCVAVGGVVIYDPISHIKCRQHGSNVIGSQSNILVKLKSDFKRYPHTKEQTAQELLNGFKDKMSSQNVYIASLVANYRNSVMDKLKLFFCKEIRVKGWKSNIYIKMKILFGKL